MLPEGEIFCCAPAPPRQLFSGGDDATPDGGYIPAVAMSPSTAAVKKKGPSG